VVAGAGNGNGAAVGGKQPVVGCRARSGDVLVKGDRQDGRGTGGSGPVRRHDGGDDGRAGQEVAAFQHFDGQRPRQPFLGFARNWLLAPTFAEEAEKGREQHVEFSRKSELSESSQTGKARGAWGVTNRAWRAQMTRHASGVIRNALLPGKPG